MQAPDAPVPRIGAAFHHPARFQPVDQPGDADRLDLQQFGEFLLGQAGLTLQPDQDGPLRTGHAVGAGPLVGIDAQQPGDIVQQEQQVALEAGHLGVSLPRGAHHKQRYDQDARGMPELGYASGAERTRCR